MGEYVFNFVEMKKGNLFADDVGEIDEGGIKGFNLAAGKVFHKTAEGDEVVGLGDGFQILAAIFGAKAVKFQAIFTENFAVDVGRFDVNFAKNVLSDFEEAVEVEAVVFDSFFRAAAFDFEVFEEVVD